MNILYIGDIMGRPGIDVVRRVLPELRQKKQIDLVIAQAENTTEGKGISALDFKALQDMGVDFCTGGNWSLFRSDIIGQLNDPNVPIIRPANLPADSPGLGWKYAQTPFGKALVISLLGQIIGRDADKAVSNPLKTIDAILAENKDVKRAATIVNLHGDYSSEKVMIGYYLDGSVSAVVGDHWHVPTADAMVLPGGTAHVTDVGMCGTLHSSLGVKLDIALPRWRDTIKSKNVLETEGPLQFNAVLIGVDPHTGLVQAIEPIRRLLNV